MPKGIFVLSPPKSYPNKLFKARVLTISLHKQVISMNTAVILFLNLGTSEIVLILFVVMLLFGANKIPELARGIGKGMREFKDATNGIQREIQDSARKMEQEAKKIANDTTKDITDTPDKQ